MLKDGSATCPSQITRNDSTQNLSLCGYNWSTKTSWTLAEPIGNSEHLPITIIINHNHQSSSIHISLFNNDSHIFNLTSRRQDQTKSETEVLDQPSHPSKDLQLKPPMLYYSTKPTEMD